MLNSINNNISGIFINNIVIVIMQYNIVIDKYSILIYIIIKIIK